MSRKSNILIAAVAGLAVGIGIGMIIAPAKGSKTRKKLRARISDIADRLEESLPGTFEEVRNLFSGDKETPEENETEPASEKPVNP